MVSLGPFRKHIKTLFYFHKTKIQPFPTFQTSIQLINIEPTNIRPIGKLVGINLQS